MQPDKPTEISEVMADFDGGVFTNQATAALADAALGVVTHGDKGRKGKVLIELTIERIGESSQVQISHKLAYSIPTRRGKRGEELTTQTPMYVAHGGKLSIAPENQLDWVGKDTKERA